MENNWFHKVSGSLEGRIVGKPLVLFKGYRRCRRPYVLVTAAGSWWLVAGGWWLAAGGWRLAAGGWRLVAGRWSLVAGRWSLAAGGWRLAVGRWKPELLENNWFYNVSGYLEGRIGGKPLV